MKPELLELIREMRAADIEKAIDYVMRYGGRCRECADNFGVCPASGLACQPDEARKSIKRTLEALQYGLKHGYLDAAEAALQVQKPGWQQAVRDVFEIELKINKTPPMEALEMAIAAAAPPLMGSGHGS